MADEWRWEVGDYIRKESYAWRGVQSLPVKITDAVEYVDPGGRRFVRIVAGHYEGTQEQFESYYWSRVDPSWYWQQVDSPKTEGAA